MDRILLAAGWPTNPEVFTGQVKLSETRYPEGEFVIEWLGEGEWPE